MKEALRKSIVVWDYLAKVGGEKDEVTEKLFPGEEPMNDCFLCEAVDDCEAGGCINWLDNGEELKYSNSCLVTGSVFSEWDDKETPENAQNVADFLHREWVRRYGK